MKRVTPGEPTSFVTLFGISEERTVNPKKRGIICRESVYNDSITGEL
jgi:hypothetical protein